MLAERKHLGSTGTFVALMLSVVACAPPLPVEATHLQPRAPDGGGTADSTRTSATAMFLVRDANGHLSVVETTSSEAAALRGEVVSPLAPSVPAKLANASMVLAHLERAKKGEPSSLYAKLDGSTAPKGEEARKEGLRATGVLPQTVAGDVATVLVTPEKLGALLALPWVLGLEAPGIVMPR